MLLVGDILRMHQRHIEKDPLPRDLRASNCARRLARDCRGHVVRGESLRLAAEHIARKLVEDEIVASAVRGRSNDIEVNSPTSRSAAELRADRPPPAGFEPVRIKLSEPESQHSRYPILVGPGIC